MYKSTSRGTVGLFVLVAVVAMAAAVEVLPLPGDQALHVTLYKDGILRVVVRPNTGDYYRVSDVVVAERLPSSELKVTCSSDKKDCTVAGHGVSLAATVVVEGPAEETFVSLVYSVRGEVATTAKIPVSKLDAPEVTTTFPQATRLYGLPQHATDLTLKKDVTYQLLNLDVFHYKLDDAGGIYGSIPFLIAHGVNYTTGVLFLNSAEMNIRILKDEETLNAIPGAHWKAEVGLVELFFFPGGSPFSLHRQHAHITGHGYLPPIFSLGYHQCRWNYRSSDDCLTVDEGFDKHNIPYDVLWLDIEHTDGKKYFTWDLHNFPEPQKLVEAIAAKGRKMVTIKDPHIKREGGYHVHDEATAKGFYVKTESGADYEGHCWPGTSSWVDFYNKNARDWFATLFKHDRYPGSTPDLYTWLDMNEPSVFNSHQVTMDRNAVHRNAEGRSVKHRYLHNMYGYLHTMAAFQGHLLSNEGQAKAKRPFILTRSFFSGSQRFSAMWTGDNMAKWDHLEKSIPMLLSLSIANYPFVGADCGGFFFNPEAELMTRWIQAGIFYPFFRGHAHLETKRREPWLFGEVATNRIRNAIALRYSLLPYLYTTFFETHYRGVTVIRPLFYEFPKEAELFDEQNTFMFGHSLLVSPVVVEGETMHRIRFPTGALWYDFFTGAKVAAGTSEIAVTMDSIPLFQRGGTIVPSKHRLRRSTAGMTNDPITLYIALDQRGHAYGELYMDDEDTFDYEHGAFLHRTFSFSDGRLNSHAHNPELFPGKSRTKTFSTNAALERVVIFGLPKMPTKIASSESGVIHPIGSPQESLVHVGGIIPFSQVGDALVIRQPKLPIAGDWFIKLEF